MQTAMDIRTSSVGGEVLNSLQRAASVEENPHIAAQLHIAIDELVEELRSHGINVEQSSQSSQWTTSWQALSNAWFKR